MRIGTTVVLALVASLAGIVAQAAEPFAVVELFTSEGCSSCPPADRVLGQLAADAGRAGDRVYALAFHVDYWNWLGWRDRFSRAAFSHRQQRYARILGTGVYTPQMVVNGNATFLGSDADAARTAIASALSRPPAASLHLLTEIVDQPPAVVITVSLPDASGDLEISAAVVEDGLATSVTRGENARRTLHHDRVVRAFDTMPLAPDGTAHLSLLLPTDLDRAHASLVVFAQDRPTLAIIAAAGVPLATRPASRPGL